MYKLYKYLYDCDINIINHILLSDTKEVIKVFSEMYLLNGILVEEAKMEDETLDKLIENVNKLILCYDIERLIKSIPEDKTWDGVDYRNYLNSFINFVFGTSN